MRVIFLLLISSVTYGQTTYFIQADSVRLRKVGATSNLIIESGTRAKTNAFLRNYNNGRTDFAYAVDSIWKMNDSTFIARRGDGNDTLVMPGGGGQRFGLSGEDVLATATRRFSGAGNTFEIDSLGANSYFTQRTNGTFQMKNVRGITDSAVLSLRMTGVTSQREAELYVTGNNFTGGFIADIGGRLTNLYTNDVTTGNNSLLTLGGDAHLSVSETSDSKTTLLGIVYPDSILIYSTGGSDQTHIVLRNIVPYNNSSTLKMLVQDTTNGILYRQVIPTGGSGGTPAGNYGNIAINRNGALATPASDSLDFESATGLTAIGGFRTGGSFGGVAQRIYDNASDLTISAYYATQFIANANGSWKVGSVNASDLAGVFATGTFYTNYTTILGQAGAGWNVGIGVGVPTGKLHIAAGTTTVAPQKQEAGVLLSTIQPLTKEANASSFYGSTVALNRYAEGGAIKDFIATVDNVGTGETDLFTYTTKASTLAADGEKLNFNIGGTFNDLTATAQLQFYFGGVNVGNTGALTVSATGGWSANVFLTRTSSTTVRSLVTVTTPGASTAVYTTQTDLTGLTLSGTNIIKITGTAAGASGGNGDISAKLAVITWHGAANN